MLDPDVEQAFLDIADLPEAEQETRLYALPDAIRDAVQQLIAADRCAPQLFAAAVTGVASAALKSSSAERPAGARIGAYRITGILGRGGMGLVYAAERDDGQFEQHAAIKVVEGGERFQTRFQRERQILARLSHPNIARLLDGGTTSEGMPYFVMERVEAAKPLDRYCEGLTPRQVVALFLPICRALGYVHANLVVHGDLKPGNILIGANGTPKLVDFGIARVMGEAAEQTRTVALTLNYASPEQVMGEPLTTATDVYGLASVLYRCLTGATALDVTDRPLAEAVAIVRERDPRPAMEVRAAVGEDLSRILAKALSKAPGERYSSIDALGADLEAYLDGRPVEARGSAWLYRTGKFVRRHWVPIAVALLIVAVVAGAFRSVTQSAERAEVQRHAAEVARAQAEAERAVAQSALQQADESRKLAESKTAEALSERQTAQERLASERAFMDVFTRLVDDNFLFGNKDSVRILDGWIETQQKELKARPADLAVKRLLGFLHYRRGAARARTSLRTGEEDCKAAVELLDSFLNGKSTEDWTLRTLMSANLLLGQIYAGTSRRDEAIACSRRGIVLSDLFPPGDPAGYRYRMGSRSALANVYLSAGRFDEAIRAQTEAYAVWNSRPPGVEIAGDIAIMLPATLQRYSQMLLKKDPQQAELQMKKALRIYGDLASRKSAGCLELNEYAEALNTTPFEKQRDPAVSLRFAEKAVAVCPDDRLPFALDTLAWSHFRSGATDKAIETAQRALEALPPGGSPARFVLQNSLRQFQKAPK